MRHTLQYRSKPRFGVGLVAVLAGFCCAACAQNAVRSAPGIPATEAVVEFESHAGDLARSQGRAVLVEKYLALAETQPKAEQKVYLALNAADVWLWDVPERGESRDENKAIAAYEAILTRYGSNAALVRETKFQAAAVLAPSKPKRARELYESIVRESQGDDAVMLRAYLGLGALESSVGARQKAEEYLAFVVGYDVTGLESNRGGPDISTIRRNAAVELFWLAFRQEDDPTFRRVQVTEMLKKYPEIELWEPELPRTYMPAPQESDLSGLDNW